MLTTDSYIIRLVLVVLISAVSVAYAQQKQLPGNYPNKIIRIVTVDPGGGQDFAARIIAQGISASLGQNVIVDNRTARFAGEIVAKASPDGYTLLVHGNPFWIESLIQKTPYDPVKDFAPLTIVLKSNTILVVHPSMPVTSVKELIALAKAKPGELNYAGAGVGSLSQLAMELFKSMAGVNIVHIPAKSSGPAILNVMGGDVQVMIASSASIVPHIKSGKLRALAVTSAKPSTRFPGLPTVAETLPGFEIEGNSAMFAPARTPAAIISRLNQEVVRVLNQAEVKEKFLNVDAETVGSSPGELAAKIKSDMVNLGKVIKDAGIHGE